MGFLPATFFLPVPLLPFYHPIWFGILSVLWMGLTVWLRSKGLGVSGITVLLRRWLQGRRLPPRF